jgi:hypothetical protein
VTGDSGIVTAPSIGQQAWAKELENGNILVGSAPCGTSNTVSRCVAEKLLASYAKSAELENETAAGGQIVVSCVKAAGPDGASMLLTPMSMLGIAHLQKPAVRTGSRCGPIRLCLCGRSDGAGQREKRAGASGLVLGESYAGQFRLTRGRGVAAFHWRVAGPGGLCRFAPRCVSRRAAGYFGPDGRADGGSVGTQRRFRAVRDRRQGAPDWNQRPKCGQFTLHISTLHEQGHDKFFCVRLVM